MTENERKFGTERLSPEFFISRNKSLARALDCENILKLGPILIKTLFISHHYEEKSMSTIFHTHNHYEISMMNLGTVEYKTSEKIIEIDEKRADWLVLPPGFQHQRVCAKTPSVIHGYSLTIDFENPSSKGKFDALIKKSGYIFPGSQDLCDSLQKINEELNTSEILKHERVAILLKDMLLRFFRLNFSIFCSDSQSPSTGSGITLKMIDSYIEENLSEDISLNRLSSFCGFSPRHLNRLFVKARGIPLLRYITRKKMEAAMRELATSRKMIKEIALELGYEDQSYFNRVFKKQFGKTPEECRDEYGRNNWTNALL